MIYPTAKLIVLFLLTQFTSSSRVCKTIRISHPGYETHRNLNLLRAQLEHRVAGCQLVFGDVIIENFGVSPISEAPVDEAIRSLPTDFLDSIEEIRGQLFIKRANLELIVFRNLRTIHGHNMEWKSPFYALEVLQSPYPTRLELPMLSAILRGGVRLIGTLHASLYCPLSRSIDWANLFQNHSGPQQQVIDFAKVNFNDRNINFAGDSIEVQTACSSMFPCDVSCPATASGRRLCWSGGPNGCQKFHGCLKRPCRSCYRHPETGSEECCNSECLGGCAGRPEACSACREVRFNGVCTSSCHPLETGEWGLKQLGHICVRKCGSLFLNSLDSHFCLRECPPDEIPIDGACKLCPDGSCKICTAPYPILSDEMSLKLANKGCPIWKAKPSLTVNARHLTDEASLESLESLVVFYGRLNILRTSVDSLRFLRNLRHVSDAFFISLLETRYLALASLKYANPLALVHVRGLCRAWYPSKRIQQIRQVTKEFPIVIRGLEFDEISETCRMAACDPRCRDECWGPGPELCVA